MIGKQYSKKEKNNTIDRATIAKLFGLGSNLEGAMLTEEEYISAWKMLEREMFLRAQKCESEIKKAKLCVEDSVE